MTTPKLDPEKMNLPVTRAEAWEILSRQEDIAGKLYNLILSSSRSKAFESLSSELLSDLQENHRKITDLIATGVEAGDADG